MKNGVSSCAVSWMRSISTYIKFSPEDVDYIMETFPIVKRKDEKSYDSYRTKDLILNMYDAMANLPRMAVPAPKDESATYAC